MPNSFAPTPCSPEAERTTLGTLLLDPDKIIDVAPILQPRDFYDPTHRSIYAAICKLYEDRTPIDYLTVCEALESDERVQRIGGSAFLASMAQDVPTSSHAVQYAEIVKNKSIQRALANAGAKIAELASSDERSTTELVEAAEQELLKLSIKATQAEPTALSDICSDRFDHYAEAFESGDPAPFAGVSTGFVGLDALLGGLRAGHLMVLAARPSMGKTSLALHVARNVVTQGKSVGIFSLEMTKEDIADRFVAGDLGVEVSTLNRGTMSVDKYRRLGGVMDALTPLPIFIDDDPDRTLAGIRSRSRRLHIKSGIDLLIIDYLQLIEADHRAGENQTQRISHISKSLKHLARELDCPVIVLSQLNRECEKRTPPIPVLSDLRDSGSIEQDADSVLMLYRQGYYDEDCDRPTVTDVFVRKQRQGPTGRVELDFDGQRMRFLAADKRSLAA